MDSKDLKIVVCDDADSDLYSFLEKNGITIEQIDQTEILETDLNSRYRKLTPEELSQLNHVFQYLPNIAKDLAYNASVKNAFDNATKETYRIILDPALHLGNSQNNPGALSSNAYDINNKLKTHADLIPNNAELTISNAPQIIGQIFNVLSFITGQYFMSQINQNLLSIKSEITEVKQFLENYKNGEIRSAVMEMDEIYNHSQYIMNSEIDKYQALEQLKYIKRVSRKYLEFPKTDIEQSFNTLSNNNCKNSLHNSLIQYIFLVNLNCKAIIAEVFIKNSDVTELHIYRNELNKIIEDSTNYIDSVITRYKEANKDNNTNNEKNNKVFDPFNIISKFTNNLVSTIVQEFNDQEFIDKLASTIAQKLPKELEKTDYNELIQKLSTYYKTTQTIDTYRQDLIQPIKLLDTYIKQKSQKIEIIKSGDEIYISN